MSVAKVTECDSCGAPVPPHSVKCTYCGSWLDSAGRQARDGNKSSRKLAWIWTDAGEFGFSSSVWLYVGLGVALVLYLSGWLLEDTRYWLDDRAIVVWSLLLPGWLGIVAFVWQSGRPTWRVALAWGLFQWATHTAAMAFVRGSLNDDHVGIGAMFAGAAVAGWLLGRLVRLWTRHRRLSAAGRRS